MAAGCTGLAVRYRAANTSRKLDQYDAWDKPTKDIETLIQTL